MTLDLSRFLMGGNDFNNVGAALCRDRSVDVSLLQHGALIRQRISDKLIGRWGIFLLLAASCE